MALSNPYANYKETQVKTASPLTLIILLYEGAVKDIMKGEKLIGEEAGFAEASKHLLRAMNIVSELLGVINPGPSPDLAKKLSESYESVLALIGMALNEKDPEPLSKAAEIMNTLLSAWREMAQQVAQQAG